MRARARYQVERVFLKQRIDLLTSKAWFQDSQKIKAEVVDLSTAASMPCAYTSMITFETTAEKLAAFSQKQARSDPMGTGAFPYNP